MAIGNEISKNDGAKRAEEAYLKRYKKDEIAGVKKYKDDLVASDSISNRYAVFSYLGNDSRIKNANPRLITQTEPSTSSDVIPQNAGSPISTEDEFDPKTSRLVRYFSPENEHAPGIGAMIYEWADFLYTKFDGKLANNRLVTLRRFPRPVEDDITNPNMTEDKDIARMLTWFGDGTDNSLNDILQFGVGFNWKEQMSEVQEISKPAYGGTLGPFGLAELPFLNKGKAGAAAGVVDTGVKKLAKERAYQYDPLKSEKWSEGPYSHLVNGPVNVVHKMWTQDRGLNYEKTFKLKFNYKLKSYGKISPKEALLDVLANALTTTFNNAPFWGGSVRYLRGAGQESTLLGDQALLRNGKVTEYFGSVFNDLGGVFKRNLANGDGKFSLGSILSGGSAALFDDFMGSKIKDNNIFGGMNVAKALLTGESTGEWHLTVGNPFRPILMMGNLILESSQFSFEEALGTDDFPIGFSVEISLKPARPRDSADIQSSFNAGKGRLYYYSKEMAKYVNPENGRPIPQKSGGSGTQKIAVDGEEPEYRKDTIKFNRFIRSTFENGSIRAAQIATKFSPTFFQGITRDEEGSEQNK